MVYIALAAILAIIIILVIKSCGSSKGGNGPNPPPKGTGKDSTPSTPGTYRYGVLPKKFSFSDLAPEKIAGRQGEWQASNIISAVLTADDHLLSNVEIVADEKRTELDNVIVNEYGVFIIEVKSYQGWLIGNADDYMWEKYNTTDAGNTYFKEVKNPIKQVNRQVYILHKYLEYYGMRVWVEGYALLLGNNSPLQHKQILTSQTAINTAIHTPGKRQLTQWEIQKIIELLRP